MPPLRERPSWDVYFLGLAQMASQRSPDGSTQHGCVLVRDKVPVITGFNGLPAEGDDSAYPQHRDPGVNKYVFYSHAEENAVALAAYKGRATRGCTAYVTGLPCVKCLRLLHRAGIVRVVHLSRKGWTLDAEEAEARALFLRNTGLRVDVVDVDLSHLLLPTERQAGLPLNDWHPLIVSDR